MKYFIPSIFILLSIISNSQAQNSPSNTVVMEDMYVHVNSSLLFSGEYLYYRLYCLDASTHTQSKQSGIGYVALIDINKKTIFEHKIILKDGLGQGDFFVPSTIPSGVYKLVAYTQWMQNNPVNKFFEASIKIVNPYIAEINNNQAMAVINILNPLTSNTQNNSQSKGLNIKIILENKKPETRSPLNITLQNNMGIQGNGDYSISVRKLADIEGPASVTATKTTVQKSNITRINPKEATHKAETAGYLLRGEIINKETQLPVKATDVAISIPGKNFYFSVATTNSLGAFSFEIDPDFPGEEVVIQVVENNKEGYSIKLFPKYTPNYSKLEFPTFSLKESEKARIVARSIYNQIENGYYDLKPDTVVEKLPATSFVRYEKGVTYTLDDYTRFKTMKEVFTEIVRFAWTTSQDGKRIVKVLEREMSTPTSYLPLLFIDGTFIENPEVFLDIDAMEVQTIKVIRKGYYFGKKEYQGVIVMSTHKGDYTPLQHMEAIVKKPLFIPQQSKNYFSQSYTEANADTTKRIPDYRVQLLWNPSLKLTNRKTKILMYTSDIPGIYEVVVEGFTNQGLPVSLSESFEVFESSETSN